jgi:hypothetical protein
MEHYCPIHPQIAEAIVPLLDDSVTDEDIYI